MEERDGIRTYDVKKAFDILELIKIFPERYLTENTINSLQDFLNGYLCGNPYPDDEPPFWNFNNWLLGQTKFQYEGGKKNLTSRILLHETKGDQDAAFLLFFEFLDKYKNGDKNAG